MNTTTASTTSVELEKFLIFAACIVRNLGYVSGTVAKEKGIQSTGQLAFEWATQGRTANLRALMLLPEDKVMGKVVAKWLGDLQVANYTGNEYMIKLCALGVAQSVTEKYIGYAASAIQTMQREQQKDPAHPANAEKFLAKVGEKISETLVCVDTDQFHSRFGLCYKYSFEDNSKRRVVWMTSSPLDLKIGQKYLVTGTVKKQNSYRGRCETEISRAKVTAS